jgi:thiol-disulfide isomerase/thioredoxin
MADKNALEDPAPDQAEAPRVITVGWQLPALLVVGLVVLVGGYFLGRGGSPPASGAEPQVVVVANPTADALATLVAEGGNLQPQDYGTEVVPLQERYHPLNDTKAPDFQLQVLSSQEKVRLGGLAGKPVLVNFWATWCPPCRLEMPWIESVYQKYKDKGFVVLGVDAGEKVPAETVEATVKQYVESQGLTFPILLDPGTYQLQQAWAVMGLPASFLINPKGTISFVHTGMFPNEATLDDLVQRILPGGEWADAEPAGAATKQP